MAGHFKAAAVKALWWRKECRFVVFIGNHPLSEVPEDITVRGALNQ
jgi:hypothetical protein